MQSSVSNGARASHLMEDACNKMLKDSHFNVGITYPIFKMLGPTYPDLIIQVQSCVLGIQHYNTYNTATIFNIAILAFNWPTVS
jgi:hypothetical protein